MDRNRNQIIDIIVSKTRNKSVYIRMAKRLQRKGYTRPLAEPRILFSGQEKINEEPQCTKVHEDSEFIFDEPRKQKTMVSQEVF